MSDYPVPSYAANIWIAGDKIMLGFPSTVGGRSHSVALPMTDKGLAVALDILKERSTSTIMSIGTRAAPTKWNIENDARYNAFIRVKREQEQNVEQILKELQL
jgi:hypothetical protein